MDFANFTLSNQIVNENLYVLRAMLYLLTPNETFYEHLNQVPNLTQKSMPIFFVLILFEQVLFLIKEGRFNGRVEDMVSSLAAGMIYLIPRFFFREFHIIVYEYVYENFHIIELPWNSEWTYLFTLLFFDMMFYWFHRASHEINILWAGHQTHHSSEDFNLSSALRQSLFQKYCTWIFYMPLALFIRPSIYVVHSHMNLIYQFWIHTEIVDRLGLLEYILNTASHHRVHHGRNPYCIDKNYAGVLIIWDRIFGTFEEEKKDEKIAYGLVHPIESFDPTFIQVFNYQYLLKRCFGASSLNEIFSILFKGPGWMPGTGRLGNSADLPAVEYPIKKYTNNVSVMLNVYIGFHFLFVSITFSEFLKRVEIYPVIVLTLFAIFLIYSLTCFGFYFDNKKYAVLCDIFRCSVSLACFYLFKSDLIRLLYASNLLFEAYKYYYIISLTGLVANLFKNELSLLKKIENLSDQNHSKKKC